MTKSRKIFFFLYDGFEMLDMAGPASVFNAANRELSGTGYRCIFVSAAGGMVRCNTGLCVETKACNRIRIGNSDVLLIAGADEEYLQIAMMNDDLVNALLRTWPKAGRVASVCSGSFLLAKAGALKGRKATTHWAGRRQMARAFPDVRVEDDALYVVDGNRWTSAGVTTGIDMALAMVRLDHGSAVMRAVAKRLVVYAHRPGNQSQFSSLVDAQTSGECAFDDLIAWMDGNTHKAITVAALASRVNMSERTFHRKFVKSVGDTPARFLENLRLQKAREALEAGMSAKEAACRAGFQSLGGFRTAFESRFGITPAGYRKMHAPE